MPQEQEREQVTAPARGIDWGGITIGIKEFFAGVVFVVTMSGVYYKLYYQQSEDRIKSDSKIEKLQKELDELKAHDDNNDKAIRNLQDDQIRRDAAEPVREVPYTPMKKVK